MSEMCGGAGGGAGGGASVLGLSGPDLTALYSCVKADEAGEGEASPLVQRSRRATGWSPSISPIPPSQAPLRAGRHCNTLRITGAGSTPQEG